MSSKFAPSSVVLGYFLVGGGLMTGFLAAALLRVTSEGALYGLLAAGSAIGGFFAARASRGETIIEPAIAAILVVGTIAALTATTKVGGQLWSVAQGELASATIKLGLCGAFGAVVGAAIGEKLFGEATTSSLPWVLYSALATFGGAMLAMAGIAIVALGNFETGDDDVSKMVGMLLVGMAGGCLLAGMAIGASARTRPLFAALVGGGVGVWGFLYLATQPARAGRHGDDTNGYIALAVLAVGGAIATLIGAALGWAIWGKKAAASDAAV